MSDARDTNALSDVGVAAPPASALEGANVAAPALGAPPASQGAAPAAISGNATPSLFGGILRGALAGLAGSAGARSASQAFGMGAAAQAAQAQQDTVNQQQQDQAAQQKQAAADAHMLSQQQYANATLNYQMLAAKFATMPKNLQQELEQDQWKVSAALEQDGSQVGQPYKSKADALQAATAYNQTALQKGDNFNHAIPLERSDGTFGVYVPKDGKNTQSISLTTAEGKTITIPPGQMSSKDYVSAMIAIGKDKFDRAETTRHNKETEAIGRQNANTNTTKAEAAANSTEWKPKVTADEKKKAELAENIAKNAGDVADILVRRPDLVGAVSGRFTSVEQMVGNNDPDIAAIGTHIHNLAMANSGVHGFRSQEGVKSYEQQILNNFKNGPRAVAGALKASTSSVQTFIDNARPDTYITHSKNRGAVMGMRGNQ